MPNSRTFTLDRSKGRGRSAAIRHLASEVGQGTVEYVGLLLLMATLLAGVVGIAEKTNGKNAIPDKIVHQINTSIDKAGSGK